MRSMPDSPAALQGERFLDLRGLEPPAPLMRVFEALDAAPDRPLRARFPREPFPLYAMLQAGAWSSRTVACEDGSFEILISRKA
jgi:hypothetical protein